MHLSQANQHSPRVALWVANKNALWTCHPHWWQILLTSLITLHLLHPWIYYSSHWLLASRTCASLVTARSWGASLFCSTDLCLPSLTRCGPPSRGARFSNCVPAFELNSNSSHHALREGSKDTARPAWSTQTQQQQKEWLWKPKSSGWTCE